MAERITTPTIGIDLGTTNSCVAVWRNGTLEIIPNQRGSNITPSCVTFTDMRHYKGKDAANRAITDPCSEILNVKRLIGERFSSTNVQDDKELLPFSVVEGPGDNPMISEYQCKAKRFSAVEISSLILRNLCDTAMDFLKGPIKNVVISVPACFNDSQRFATMEAGKMAGLNVMRLINEPTAAAIAYGFNTIENNDGDANKKNVLIFDLGGGTLDVSILTMERGNYEVKATVGDAHLGGVDFDNQLMKHCIKELEKRGRPNSNLQPKDLRKLRTSCENAKRALSVWEEARIDGFSICINRAEFEELNKNLFDKCIAIVDKCLVDANMYRSSIHDVVLIGVSTRIPKVQQMLREFFDGKEPSTGINPNEAVAFGAAIQAAILMGGMSNYAPDLVVSDITTHSVGIKIAQLDEFMIPRKTVIPTTEEIILPADQIEFPIKVYEGEKTVIEDNNPLGELKSSNGAIPFGLGDIIVVRFYVDENGIFTISVEDKMARQRKITMIQITRDLQELKKEGDKMPHPHLFIKIMGVLKAIFNLCASPN